MNPGKLRHLVTVQTTTGETARRGVAPTYVDNRQVWAAIEPIKTTIKELDEQLKEIQQYKVTLWNIGQLDTSMRIKTDTHYYGITSIERDDPFSTYLVLTCHRTSQ